MKNQKNNALSREALEQLPTGILEEQLRTELEKEPPDGERIRMLMGILEQRDQQEHPGLTPEDAEAWEKYQAKLAEQKKAPEKRGRIWSRGLKAAAAAVVLGVLFLAIPQKAEAESFFEMLTRWTDSIFELFGSSSSNNQHVDYVFVTDNPGLQEVYDAVTSLGVTEPVVPMWLPEGAELEECKIVETPTKKGLLASFILNGSEIVIKIDSCDIVISREYHKDNLDAENYEIEGIVHNIMMNENMWVVVWTNQNFECSIALNCQKDVIYKIIESIYIVEDA